MVIKPTEDANGQDATATVTTVEASEEVSAALERYLDQSPKDEPFNHSIISSQQCEDAK
jgi:hypothetical protein